ncbi:THAP domain-containing protein 5-like isoform X1 [Pseudorasbora parva]|uniref:THAP domain-containing protein 5-like isoform X1 n=1 Tax=Pseudorasbora parva TaxID=51549 RepID=UPI00351EBD80
MVVTCVAMGCTAKTRKGQVVRFHQFPAKDLERCKQWLRAINHPKFVEDDVEKHKKKKVCSRHFKKEDYEPNVLGMKKVTLKDTAIPSIFTFPEDEEPRPSGKKRIRRKMAVNKKKSEDLKIQHVFSLREETEEQAKVAIIKEERDDIRIEHPFSLKQEETEQQTGLMTLKEESQEFNEKEEKYIYETHQDFLPEEKSFSCSETKKDTGTRIFTCPQCGTSSSVNIKTLKSA